jgi:protease-4
MNKPGLIILAVVVGVVFLVVSGLLLVGSAGERYVPGRGNSVGMVEVFGVISDARRTVREIRTLARDPQVPVILLHINSPGGVVAPSYEIYRELQRTRTKGKKLVVAMGTVAASGGYYIAIPADVIVANPSTITGSIGVIMEFPNVDGLMRKLGLQVEVVKSREFKDIGSPYRPMKPAEKELLEDMVLDVYDQFVTAVAEGRDLPAESVARFADGRVFSGRQAHALGLVDSLGTLSDAVEIAARLAGISGEPRLVRVPRPFRFRDFLFDDLLGRLMMPALAYRFP